MTKNLDPKIQKALTALNKKNKTEGGIPAVRQLSDHPDILVESFPTGSVSLDYLFGCGGLPKGRVIEIHGKPSSGKTTLSLHLVAQVQQQGGTVAWVDAEACFEQIHADTLGVQKEKFIYIESDTGEKLFDTIDTLAESGVDLIVVDSVAALVPEKELESEIGDQQIGLQARLLSKGLRKLTSTVHKSGTTIIFINQLRDNINTFGFGPKTTTPGGKALPYYSSVRIEVAKKKTYKDSKDKVIGMIVKMKAVKNKVAPPFREIELDFYFEGGFDFNMDLIAQGLEHGILSKEANTIFYGKKKLGGSAGKAAQYLYENEEEKNKIEEEIKDTLYPARPTKETEGGTD